MWVWEEMKEIRENIFQWRYHCIENNLEEALIAADEFLLRLEKLRVFK
jgi:hypothetical protein